MNQEVFSLRRDSADLLPLLNEGKLMRHGEFWIALPREIVTGVRGAEAVVFELMRSESMIRPSVFKIGLKALRPENLTLTLSPCLATLIYGFYRGWNASLGIGLLAVLGALFFQIAVYLFNDVEDHLRLIDLLDSQAGSRVIQNGWLSAKELKRMAYLALTLGVLVGLPAVLRSPEILLWIGGAGALGVLGFSNQPLGIKYRVLGDFAVWLLGGPLIGIGFAQAAFGKFDSGVLWLGGFFGFLCLSVNHAGNFQNLESRRGQNLRNLATQFGFRHSRHFFPLFYTFAAICIWGGMLGGSLPLMPGFALCATLPWIIHLIRTIYKASGPASALLVPLRRDSLRLHVILAGISILALVGATLNLPLWKSLR